MLFSQLRIVLGALIALSGFVVACAQNHARVMTEEAYALGPQLGQSRDPGPDRPPPLAQEKPADPLGVSAPISFLPRGQAPNAQQPQAPAPASELPQPGVFSPPPPADNWPPGVQLPQDTSQTLPQDSQPEANQQQAYPPPGYPQVPYVPNP